MKLLFSFLICILFSSMLSAQSGFFGRMKKPESTPQIQRSIISKTRVTDVDSTFGAIRPITIPMAFSIPDNQIMAGAGFGYQNITYNYITGKFYCNWSVNIVGLLGGSVVPTNPAMASSYAVTVGFLNNSINAGVKFNSRKDDNDVEFKLKPNLIVAYYINFNN